MTNRVLQQSKVDSKIKKYTHQSSQSLEWIDESTTSDIHLAIIRCIALKYAQTAVAMELQ